MTLQNIPQGQDNNTHHALICTRCSLVLDHDVETLPDIFLELAHVNALGPLGVVNKFRPYTTRLARRCREQVLLTRVLLRQATALSIVSAVVVETGTPDAFYSRLTELAASGEFGSIDEVTSPDDNLQAVFQYLVK